MAQNTDCQLLIIDGDHQSQQELADLCSACGFRVVCCSSGPEAFDQLAAGLLPSLILLDILLPGPNGSDILEHIRRTYPQISVVMILSAAQISTDAVVRARKLGVVDSVVKPFSDLKRNIAVQNSMQKRSFQAEAESRKVQPDPSVEGDFITRHPRLLRIKEDVKRIADKKYPVLITGESGVGKEALARFIHNHSSQHDKPFVKVNCTLPDEPLESELFGIESGEFTGGMNNKPGKFELADKGTLLLDEIGEMTPHLQAKLLHVLYHQEYSRLGGKRTIHMNARVLSSTNVNLEERVKNGKFSFELYIKLSVIRFDIPPLYERREDIPILCNYFLQKYRDLFKSTEEISPEMMDGLLEYDWPGNVPQLEHFVKLCSLRRPSKHI